MRIVVPILFQYPENVVLLRVLVPILFQYPENVVLLRVLVPSCCRGLTLAASLSVFQSTNLAHTPRERQA